MDIWWFLYLDNIYLTASITGCTCQFYLDSLWLGDQDIWKELSPFYSSRFLLFLQATFAGYLLTHTKVLLLKFTLRPDITLNRSKPTFINQIFVHLFPLIIRVSSTYCKWVNLPSPLSNLSLEFFVINWFFHQHIKTFSDYKKQKWRYEISLH